MYSLGCPVQGHSLLCSVLDWDSTWDDSLRDPKGNSLSGLLRSLRSSSPCISIMLHSGQPLLHVMGRISMVGGFSRWYRLTGGARMSAQRIKETRWPLRVRLPGHKTCCEKDLHCNCAFPAIIISLWAFEVVGPAPPAAHDVSTTATLFIPHLRRLFA